MLMFQWWAAGSVKKLALPTRMLHDKYSKAFDIREEMLEQLTEAMKFNKELKAHVNRIFDSLNPVRVLSLFERMIREVFHDIFSTKLSCWSTILKWNKLLCHLNWEAQNVGP